MNPEIISFFTELKKLALLSERITKVQIRGEEVLSEKGYLRMRMVLNNKELIELFVYVATQKGQVSLKDYSLQWQKEDASLIQRWDNATHHHELENFPYHIHKENQVHSTPKIEKDDIVRILSGIITKGGQWEN